MTPTKTTWVRIKGKCPVCQHRGWCTQSSDGSVVKCMRVHADREAKDGGYVHDLSEPLPRAEAKKEVHKGRAELELFARQFETAVNPVRLEKLAADLGLSIASLKRLRIGWYGDKRAWAFPMTDASGGVLGFRLRFANGVKISLKGGHEGLFVPRLLPESGWLGLPEGPTSTAALLDLGCAAIGRPSAMSGDALIVQYLDARPRRDVVIFAEDDQNEFQAGERGAIKLAQAIVRKTKSLKIVYPPFKKDPRAWLQAGATHAAVEAVVRAANYYRGGSA